MSAGEPVRLDLAALRAELAASPRAGRLHPLGLGRVIEGDGALDELARAVADFPRSAEGVVVLAAATPMRVAGWDLKAEATAVLGRGFAVDWATLGPADGQVHADERTLNAARQATAGAGCVVTIGSGTITDIGKAATRNGTPLVAVQTATSVNGYADPFSVLLHRGVKRTVPSRWPDTLLIDAAVLRAAPPDLNLAGVGDLMAMFTSTADWYLASAMSDDCGHDTAAARSGPGYDATVAGIVRAHGGRLLALAADLAAGAGAGADARAGARAGAGAGAEANPGGAAAETQLAASLAELARILTLSGITMGVAGSTAPASGMEHAVSHLLEMAANARGQRASFHGTQVGVASVVAAATWAHLRRRIDAGALGQPARIPDPDQARDRIREAFKGIDSTGLMAAECFADYARKLRPLIGDSDPLARLRASWDSHEVVLGETLIDPGELASGLRSAGLPASFGELPEPVSDEDARWAVASCPLLRQRFGVADLAMLLGAWEEDDIDEVLADAAVLTGQP
jgi:glycerol-1-phosphate dehydrogenase [NAD(P)+]